MVLFPNSIVMWLLFCLISDNKCVNIYCAISSKLICAAIGNYVTEEVGHLCALLIIFFYTHMTSELNAKRL